MNFIEELEVQVKLLNEVKETTNKMSREMAGAFAAMIIEEWCLANGGEAVKMFDELRTVGRQVNEELGTYQEQLGRTD